MPLVIQQKFLTRHKKRALSLLRESRKKKKIEKERESEVQIQMLLLYQIDLSTKSMQNILYFIVTGFTLPYSPDYRVELEKGMLTMV